VPRAEATAVDHDEAVARLLGLLRTGEQSAELAFGRMARRVSPVAGAQAQHTLAGIAADEARHDRMLVTGAAAASVVAIRPEAAVRRFFVGLQSRELGIHLARVAALDGCVCQVLAGVLSANVRARLPPPLVAALVTIRRDEGRHVRVARDLVGAIGTPPATVHDVDLATRHAFSGVLASFDASLSALGLDVDALSRRVQRHAD